MQNPFQCTNSTTLSDDVDLNAEAPLEVLLLPKSPRLNAQKSRPFQPPASPRRLRQRRSERQLKYQEERREVLTETSSIERSPSRSPRKPDELQLHAQTHLNNENHEPASLTLFTMDEIAAEWSKMQQLLEMEWQQKLHDLQDELNVSQMRQNQLQKQLNHQTAGSDEKIWNLEVLVQQLQDQLKHQEYDFKHRQTLEKSLKTENTELKKQVDQLKLSWDESKKLNEILQDRLDMQREQLDQLLSCEQPVVENADHPDVETSQKSESTIHQQQMDFEEELEFCRRQLLHLQESLDSERREKEEVEQILSETQNLLQNTAIGVGGGSLLNSSVADELWQPHAQRLQDRPPSPKVKLSPSQHRRFHTVSSPSKRASHLSESSSLISPLRLGPMDAHAFDAVVQRACAGMWMDKQSIHEKWWVSLVKPSKVSRRFVWVNPFMRQIQWCQSEPRDMKQLKHVRSEFLVRFVPLPHNRVQVYTTGREVMFQTQNHSDFRAFCLALDSAIDDVNMISRIVNFESVNVQTGDA